MLVEIKRQARAVVGDGVSEGNGGLSGGQRPILLKNSFSGTTQKFPARRGVAPARTWRTMRSSAACDQERSYKRPDDLPSELLIATRPRENWGSLQFGVFQTDEPVCQPFALPENGRSTRELSEPPIAGGPTPNQS